MSDHHDDHPLPPPEEDKIDFASVTVWGVGSFIAVLISVFGLAGYFWSTLSEVESEANQRSVYAAQHAELKASAAEKLKGLKAAQAKVIESQGNAIAKPAPKEAAPAIVPANAQPGPFASDAKLVAQGKALFTAKMCNTCHSLDGTRLVGPSMKGIYGRLSKMTNGTAHYADEAYITQSIKEPNALHVEGYPPGGMVLIQPVNDKEIKAIVHYVSSLK
jgi:cytochrome c oxidase subunit 2